MNTKRWMSLIVLPALVTGIMFSPCYADDALDNRIERLEQRVDRLERTLHSLQKPDSSSLPLSSRQETISEQVLEEEMGSVEGVIRWQGKPLDHGEVKIVLTKYTGFSLGALKKMFQRDSSISSDQQKVTFVTKTDSQGRYLFEKIPPGRYRLYWLPDKKTGWIRRLREKPDFEVTAGKRTLQNIPVRKE